MENINLLPENEYTEVEERAYLNPNLPIERTNTFIDNLRSTQQANNQQIETQTQRLGTDVPSDLGGLTGAGSYFTSRFQTPQTNSVVQGLRTAAQSAALNQALENEQAMWKKRYNDAYKAYQKRQHDKANATTGGGGGGKTKEGGVEYEDTDSNDKTVASVEPSYSPMGSGDFEFTSNASKLNGGGTLSGGGALSGGGTLTPNGNVNIQRDKFGNITSLTYNGKTFTGNAAKTRYDWLLANGTISGRK